MSAYIALRFWHAYQNEQFQISSPLWLKKLPMEEQSASVTELNAAIQSQLPVRNIKNDMMAKAIIS